MPAPGTARYLCPLECGWHHDVPPPSIDRAIELGVVAVPTARSFSEAASLMTRHALSLEVEQTEQALRDHLDTHTTEQFVRVIHGLRVEIQRLENSEEPTA